MDKTLTIRRPIPPKKIRGFTLIELMIVVAIAGILAAVAYPSFMNQVRKSRRSDAVVALSNVQQAQERWRANKTTYASNVEMTTAAPNGLGLSANSEGSYYTIAVSGNTATGYTLTATAVPGKSQNNDTGCTSLEIVITNGSGVKTQPNCWSK